MNHPRKQESKKKAKVKRNDSPPLASMIFQQDGFSDAVIPTVTSAVLLVSQTKDSASAAV
jgi:hypothetical protein